MSGIRRLTRGGARSEARVVDLAAYRAARNAGRARLPLFDGLEPHGGQLARRVLSDSDVAHRERMLSHLGARTR